MEKVEQSPNILNWYPFTEGQKILKIEEIEKFKDEEITEKYDIIILLGTSPKQKLSQIITRLERILQPEGKFLIAVDNKFGIRFFAGNPENVLNKKFESLIGYNNEKEKIETYTKTSLQDTLKNLGYNTRFYYPLPDYRIPNVIFSDKQLPEYNSVDKYNPYHTEKSDILINEIDVLREILKTDKGMFTFFANSFLVEATKGNCNETYKYISFNNLRKEEYQLITKIADDYVEKQVVSEKANEHYQNIKNNIKILQEAGIETVDYIEDEKIKSKYIKQKYLLNNILTEMLEQGKEDEFYDVLDKYINIISINTYKENDYEKTVFGKYNINTENKEIIQNLNFMKNGLWDMTLKNCFLVDDKFLFFDQEWNEPSMPVEFILYRSIFYTISLRRFIHIDKLFDRYNITPYLELFRQLDNKLQENIRDNEAWEFYSRNHYFNIDATKQEIINLNIRSDAQNAANENLRKENEKLINEYEKLREINNQLQEKISNQKNEIKELQIQLKESIFKKLKRKLERLERDNKK